MSFEPDYVREYIIFGIFLLSGGLLYFLWKLDEEFNKCNLKQLLKNWICYSVMVGIVFGMEKDSMLTERICLIWFGGYLVVTTVTDTLLFQVHDVMQYLGVFGGGIWIFYKNPVAGIGFSIIIFACMQYFILMRFYGKADGMGFCICSLYLAGKGMDVEGYLYHMVFAFVMLAVVQGVKGNINGKGNLKRAIALYPYITMSFVCMWLIIK